MTNPARHNWITYPSGDAHCPACGCVRMADGSIRRGTLLPCEDPDKAERIIDGVRVTGPQS